MKDIYFDDYKNGQNNNYDGNVPLSQSEREKQARIKRQRYEQAVRNQQHSQVRVKRAGTQSNVRSQPQYPADNEYDEYEEYEQRTQPRKKAKKKRGCGCSTLFMCFLLIIALICGGTFGYVYSLCNKTNYIKPDRETSYSAMSSDDVYNVLLIGTDKENGGTSRSDSMILVSLDSKNQEIKFTSFMRDMWVEIPGYDDAKLNAAFAYGGADLLIETLEYNFKVKIDNYVLVDFDMFKALIDSIGGVDVEITEAEASFINRTTHAEVQAGVNHLDGDYALIYSRIRKLDSDFMRTQRQRKVMTAIVKKMVTQNPLTTLSAAGDVLPLITTDLAPLDMTIKGFGAVRVLTYGNDQMRIPLDGEYYDDMINGQAALVVDFEANTEALQEFIYE